MMVSVCKFCIHRTYHFTEMKCWNVKIPELHDNIIGLGRSQFVVRVRTPFILDLKEILYYFAPPISKFSSEMKILQEE